MRLVASEPEVVEDDALTLENKGESNVPEVLRPLNQGEREVVARLLDGDTLERVVSVEERRGNTIMNERVTDSVPGPTMLAPLQQAGIHPTTLANTLYQGLNARKHVVVAGRVKRVPDHGIRLKFLELAHKLRGDYPATQQQERDTDTYETRILTVMERVKRQAATLPSDTISDR